jgi:hypothetical protein
LPPFERELARDQIDGLDAVGALVDRQDAGVAIDLRRAGLLDEAHAAVHLHADGRHLAADVGGEGLGHRGEQRHAMRGRRLLGRILGAARHVGLLRRHQADGARGLGERLHGHQVAADVGVLDDRAHAALLADMLRPCRRSLA